MDQNIKEKIALSIRDFKMPEYETIPDVGLYLEQASRYVSQHLEPLGNLSLTNSMISNYVKKGLISSPVKKQYSQEQIAYLLFIAVAKTVLSLEDIQLLISLQKGSYTGVVAYNYFCRTFENILFYVCGLTDTIEELGSGHTDEKMMLRNTIITVSHKIYLDKYFAELHQQSS